MTTQQQQTPLSERTDAQIEAAATAASVAKQGDPEFIIAQLKRLRDYAAAEHLSIKQLAGRIRGVSTSVLSQLYSGDYPGNWFHCAQRISKFFDDLEKTRIYGGRRDFVLTAIAKALWTIFDKTRFNRRIQVIHSPEQLGKSRAAREYTARNNGGRTIMVTLQPGGTSNPFGVFLRDLARALDISTDHRKIIEIRYLIQDRLESCDLLILDESHLIEHWPDLAVRAWLDYLRICLHADGKRGVVLIATNNNVMSLLDTFRRRARYNLGQLLGRMCNQILDIDPADIPADDVGLLVGRYFKPKAATLRKLYDLATRPKQGHFGLLDDILARAWAESQVSGQEMSDEFVLTIAEQTMEELKSRLSLYA